MYNIYKDIENEIIDSINPIIDEYLQGRTFGTNHAKNVLSRGDYDSYFDGNKKSILDAKEFLKNKNISQLIKDIKYVGYRNFAKIEGGDTPLIQGKYKELIKKILKEIIQDRIALEKDNKIVMENVKSFEDFNMNEKVDMKELEADLKKAKKDNPDKKVSYDFVKGSKYPKGYKINIK